MNDFYRVAVMLDLYPLKTFFTFGQVLSHKETARLLHITQPAVSHALKKLEASVGAPLVTKQGRGYALTDAGQRLYASCVKIFYEIERAEEAFGVEAQGQPAQLILGATVEFGSTMLIRRMNGFGRRHPEVHVDYLFSHRLIDRLLKDEIDLIVDCWTHQNPELEVIPLLAERYAVVASPALLRRHAIASPLDLADVPVLSLDRSGDWWNNFLVMLPASERPVFRNLTQINHIRGLINGAVEGMGVALVPRYTIERELDRGVLRTLFSEMQLRDDEFCVYVKRERRDLPKIRAVIDYLKEIFEDLGGGI